MTTAESRRFDAADRIRLSRDQLPAAIDPDFDDDADELEEQFAALRRLTF